MYKLAPHPTREHVAFDCRATAALLRSVGLLVWASHVGALVAGSQRMWIPLIGWGVVLYFGIRVRLDAELMELLASDPHAAPGKLDRWLSSAGLRRAGTEERDIADRCEGARRLVRYLVVAFVGQMAAIALMFLRERL